MAHRKAMQQLPAEIPSRLEGRMDRCRACGTELAAHYVSARGACFECCIWRTVLQKPDQRDNGRRPDLGDRRTTVADAGAAARYDRVEQSLRPRQRWLLDAYYNRLLTQAQIAEECSMIRGQRVSQQAVADAIARIRNRFVKSNVQLERHPREKN